MNPFTWNWNQFKAAGRHVVTFSAGLVTFAVATNLLSPKDAALITENINQISTSLSQLAMAFTGLIAVLAPLYTSWRAAKAASPSEQVKSVVTQLSAPEITQAANALADPDSRKNLIEAVAEMPEIKKIVPVDPHIAEELPSEKVVKE